MIKGTKLDTGTEPSRSGSPFLVRSQTPYLPMVVQDGKLTCPDF